MTRSFARLQVLRLWGEGACLGWCLPIYLSGHAFFLAVSGLGLLFGSSLTATWVLATKRPGSWSPVRRRGMAVAESLGAASMGLVGCLTGIRFGLGGEVLGFMVVLFVFGAALPLVAATFFIPAVVVLAPDLGTSRAGTPPLRVVVLWGTLAMLLAVASWTSLVHSEVAEDFEALGLITAVMLAFAGPVNGVLFAPWLLRLRRWKDAFEAPRQERLEALAWALWALLPLSGLFVAVWRRRERELCRES